MKISVNFENNNKYRPKEIKTVFSFPYSRELVLQQEKLNEVFIKDEILKGKLSSFGEWKWYEEISTLEVNVQLSVQQIEQLTQILEGLVT